MTWLDPVRAALQAGDRPKALRLVVARLRQTPQDTTALLWFAALTRDRAKALAALRYVLQLEPDNAAARKALAALEGEGASPQAGPPPAGSGSPGERRAPQGKPLSQAVPRPASGEGDDAARGLRIAKNETTDGAAAEAQRSAEGGESPAAEAGRLRIAKKGERGERSVSHSQVRRAAGEAPERARSTARPGGPQAPPPTARIRGSEVLRRAGEVIWPFRGHRRPLRTLLEVGLVEERDLRWAVENAREGEIRWAAAVWLREAEVQDLNLTVAQAAETRFPFRRLNRPLGDLLREGHITLRDLAYALHRGYSPRLRQAAALLGYLVLEGRWPTPSGAAPAPSEPAASPEIQPEEKAAPTPEGAPSPEDAGGATGAEIPPPPPEPDATSPEPAPEARGPLRVRHGSRYLQAQHAHWNRRAWGRFWALMGLVALAGVVGICGGAWLAARWGRTWGYVGVAGELLLVLLVWRLTPWLDGVVNRRRAYRVGMAGEARLEEALRKGLDGRWALYRNLALPDGQGDVDAVLVGPRGVYALEVKAYSGAYRYRGEVWERKVRGRWRPIEASPSKQAFRNALRLASYLRDRGVEVWVEPRVVWAGEGRVWLDGRPEVPLWDLGRPAWMWRDLGQGKALAPSMQRRIEATLEGLVSASQEDV